VLNCSGGSGKSIDESAPSLDVSTGVSERKAVNSSRVGSEGKIADISRVGSVRRDADIEKLLEAIGKKDLTGIETMYL
jgi:hypothetical protein